MNIPQNWHDLLLAVRHVCPTAVLAGGALRDLDNEREVKDLDIFISEDSAQAAEAAADALRAEGFDINWEPGELTAYPEDQNLEVVAIMDFLGFELPVQLIFTNWDTSRIVERFDYGICRLSYDGETVTRPPEYDEDKAAQLFRLRRDRPTPVSMRGSVRRFARLTASKYAGWDWWPYAPPEEDIFAICTV